jgi:hypothetical protein
MVKKEDLLVVGLVRTGAQVERMCHWGAMYTWYNWLLHDGGGSTILVGVQGYIPPSPFFVA